MSSSAIRRALPSVVRVLISTALLSAMFAACLYLYHTAFPFLREHLLSTEKKSTAWFVEQLGYSLPFILLGLYFTIAYHRLDKRDGVASREKLWITVLVTAVTYCVLLPHVHGLSEEMYAVAVEAGAKIPETEGGVPWTLMMKLADWFIRLSIPMAIVMTFYGMRSARECRCPDAPEEPLPTVEAYSARLHSAEETDIPHPEETNEEATHV